MDAAQKADKGKKHKTITQQLHKMLWIVIIPLMGLICALLYLMVEFNSEYSAALKNANTAAEFNHDFKDKLDLDMWYHVIKPRSEQSVDDLPMAEVENARDVFTRLQQTTTLKENSWRIQSLLNMCDNLQQLMIDTANTKKYDDRIAKLENDIYVVTSLIEIYMQDYVSDELAHLSLLQTQIAQRMLMTVFISIAISVALIAWILWYSLRFTQKITTPIYELSQKVARIGDGDFNVSPVSIENSSSIELIALDEGFNAMVGRINMLMEKEIESRSALYRTELELLQTQINPHFLYNTLDSIVWLAEAQRDKDVIQMVTSLSVFFRNSLSKGRTIISVAAEQEQVKSYLEIQKIRYSDILDYEICIADSMQNASIPKLTLQPLVENAIYHGIKHKRGVGMIRITGEEDKGTLLFKVEDNGAGMSREQLQKLRQDIEEEKHTGLGLLNVHQRIKLYFGKEFGMQIDSGEGKGTTVTIRIPKELI